MRIALLSQFHWEGGRLYVENLARALASLPEGERPSLVWLEFGRHDVHPEIRAAAKVIERPPRTQSMRLNALLRRGYVAAAELKHRWDVLFPANVDPVLCSQRVAWLPDFQHESLPDYFAPLEVANRRALFERVAGRAPVVILSSHAAKRDFERVLGAHASRAHVLHFATPLGAHDLREPTQFARELEALPSRYAYLPNQFWKHKDHATALRALALLNQRSLRVPLVCTGRTEDPRNPGYFDEVCGLMRELGVAEQVSILGFVPRELQLHVFRRASFIVQPSLFEGWSTVIEDARALGKRTVLSDIDTHREQNCPQSTYFTPGSPSELATAIAKLWRLDDPPERPVAELRANAANRVHAVARTFLSHAARACR